MADAPFTEVLTNNIATESKFAFTNATGTPLVVQPALVAPVISNVLPASGTAIGATQALQLDVTDADSAFRLIMLIADFPYLGIREVIHDGVSFSQNYSGFGNARTAITNGFHYSVLRVGGWPASPSIIPYAIDVTGQENV